MTDSGRIADKHAGARLPRGIERNVEAVDIYPGEPGPVDTHLKRRCRAPRFEGEPVNGVFNSHP